MRYLDIAKLNNGLDDLFENIEIQIRKNPSLMESDSKQFKQDIEELYKRYDNIKVIEPILGNNYWAIEIIVLHVTKFITIAKSEEEQKFIKWGEYNGKYPNSRQMIMVGSKGGKVFPFLTTYYFSDPALVDTFLFDTKRDMDDFILNLKLFLPLETRIDIMIPG